MILEPFGVTSWSHLAIDAIALERGFTVKNNESNGSAEWS
jgi:hypothetical protein